MNVKFVYYTILIKASIKYKYRQLNWLPVREVYMKSLRQNANNIFLCVFEVLIGILVLIDPVAFSSGIIIAAGILMILSGAVCVFRYFWMKPEEAMLS